MWQPANNDHEEELLGDVPSPLPMSPAVTSPLITITSPPDTLQSPPLLLIANVEHALPQRVRGRNPNHMPSDTLSLDDFLDEDDRDRAPDPVDKSYPRSGFSVFSSPAQSAPTSPIPESPVTFPEQHFTFLLPILVANTILVLLGTERVLLSFAPGAVRLRCGCVGACSAAICAVVCSCCFWLPDLVRSYVPPPSPCEIRPPL